MKQTIKFCIFLIFIGGIYYFRTPLAKFLTEHIMIEDKTSDTLVHNDYFEKNDYQFIKITDDFTPKNKQDLKNIFYTVLNAGMEEFSFYCDDTYTDCIKDIDELSNDRIMLSNINNFVNPYNTFKDVETTRYEATGKIHFKINYNYAKEEIDEINQKIQKIINEKTNDTMTIEEKIKVIHDYVVENTKYDSKKSDENISEYQSTTAYGPLFEGYGLCSGYADAMKLFLNALKVPSIKIASENHIWNLVYLNNTWLHLDLTWDDPVLDNGKEIIDYSYYLITTKELYEKKDNQHYFDETVYKEAL